MMNFKEFLQYQDELNEKALNVGGKSAAPISNNICVLCGGPGSGKGFSYTNVINFRGKVFDVDKLKTNLIKAADFFEALNTDFKSKFGVPLKNLDLTRPENTANIHQYVEDRGFDHNVISAFFTTQATLSRKENVIFDVTMKNLNKLKYISEMASMAGYDLKNIHLVWILTPVNEARENNRSRPRSVPDQLVVKSHSGTSQSLQEFLKSHSQYSKYADGEFWILFNSQVEKDTEVEFHKNTNATTTVPILKKYTAIKLKNRGQRPSLELMNKEIKAKLDRYVPSDTQW